MEPELGIEQPVGSSILQLQIGPNGAEWVAFQPELGSINTRNETVTVQSIPGGLQISGNGVIQDDLGTFTTITGNGGGGNDTVDLTAVGAIAAQIAGGDGNDVLLGSDGDDQLDGNNGNDRLEGFAGSDRLRGGRGNDLLDGGDDNDTMLGEDDADVVIGGAGDDNLSGGNGNDTVSYATSTAGVVVNIDETRAYSNVGAVGDLEGSFNIAAGQATDGLGGSDRFRFTQGGSTVSGAFENIIGSNHDDTLIGNAQRNQVEAGDGNDLLIGGDEDDRLDGGAGTDTVSYRRDPRGVTVNLTTGQASDGFEDQDTLLNIENVVGSNAGDRLTGNNQSNVLQAGGGNDTLAGATGDDQLFGEAGNDTFTGDAGNDLVDGGVGTDTLDYRTSPVRVLVNLDETTAYTDDDSTSDASDLEPDFALAAGTASDGFGNTDTLRGLETVLATTGDDILIGNAVANTLQGLNGNDLLIGNAGADTLDGGNGIDTVSYRRDPAGVRVNLEDNTATDGFGHSDRFSSIEHVIGSDHSDRITGNAQDNILVAHAGDDTVSARNGNDTVYGLDGNDTLSGENGNDFLVGGQGADQLRGGDGTDTASYISATAGVIANLTAGQGAFNDAQGDRYDSIENLEGSIHRDRLIGNTANNLLTGLQGDDLLDGRAGNDTLRGGDGNDTILGSEGNDQLSGEAGDDSISGGDGIDQLTGGDGDDALSGDAGADQLEGQAGDDTLEGGDGADVLNGGDGNDVLDGQADNDTLRGGNNDDLLAGGDGADNLLGETGDDRLDGGTGNDQLNGNIGADNLTGGDGDDQLLGETGDDVLEGDRGNDSLNGGDGDDLIGGGDDQDQLTGGTGNDVLFGGRGNDTLFGNDGIDNLSGEAGDDILNGNDGSDRLDGGADRDVINGGTGNDVLEGGSEDDQLNGDSGNDELSGDDGQDTLNGGTGDDELEGNTGDDLLIGDAGNDQIDGNTENDTVSYQTSPGGVVVNLDSIRDYSHTNQPFDLQPTFAIAPATAQDGFGTIDSLANLENIIGSAFNDILIGDERANRIQGLAGDDLIIGSEGNDTLDGGSGIDTVSYHYDAAAVIVNLQTGIAIDGSGSTDQLVLLENVMGSAFNDIIVGNDIRNIVTAGNGDDQVAAGGGDDLLFGEAGNDSLAGDAGDDTLIGGTGADLLNGGPGSDTASYITASAGVVANLTTGLGTVGDAAGDVFAAIENLEGSEFVDLLIGNAANNVITGRRGNDVLVGGGAQDTFVIQRDSESDTITDFEGIGPKRTPSPAIPGERDTLRFQGAGLTARHLLLTQQGADLLISFEIANSPQVTLQNVALENLDNWENGTGNILFDGDTNSRDSYDVFDADWVRSQILTGLGLNRVTFLNELDNVTRGFDNSNDVINGQGGNDTLSGLTGDDLLRGGEGNDVLIGGRGNDVLNGGAGQNDLRGDQDNDTFVITPGGTARILDFNATADFLALSIGLTLADIEIVQGSGTETANVWINRLDTGDRLATIINTPLSAITSDRFTVLS